MERFTSFDGVGIAFEATGAGPAVLLLHGFAADHHANWVAPGVVDALVAAGRRVIAPDARGHGRSDKPHDPAAYADGAMVRDARALLDHLDVSEVDLCGYSMGSLVSMALTPIEPRVRALVLGGVGGRAADRAPVNRGRVADALLADDVSGFDPASRAFRRFAERTGADRKALAALQRARRTEPVSRLSDIAVPTLVLTGDRDVLVGPPDALAARIPGARARIVSGDHLTAVFDPAFRGAIVEFVTATT